MKKTTRLISFLLALTLVLGAMIIAPVSASAEDEDYTYVSLYLPNNYGDLAYDSETGEPLELYQLNRGVTLQGVIYDAAARTVTLNDFKRSDLMLTIHADKEEKYTVVVNGECELAGIGFTSGPVPEFVIEGTGTLTLNADRIFPQAIRLYANDYRADDGKKASLTLGKDVRLRLYGSDRIFSAMTMKNDNPLVALNGDVLTVDTVKSSYERDVDLEGYIADPYVDYLGYRLISDEDPKGVYALNDDYDQETEGWVTRITKYLYIEELDAYLTDRSFDPIIQSDEDELPSGYTYAMDAYDCKEELRNRSVMEEHYQLITTAEGEEYLIDVSIAQDLSDCSALTCTARAFTIPESGAVDADGTPYAVLGEGERVTFIGGQNEVEIPAVLGDVYVGLELFDSGIVIGNQAESYDDPDGVYAYSHYYYQDSDSSDETEIYEVSRYLYDEPHSHYFKDESFETVELSPEEFTEAYEPLYEADGETEKQLKNSDTFRRLYGASLYTDGENEYACTVSYDGERRISGVYYAEALDGVFDEGNQLYFFEPTEADDLNALTPVTETVETGAYEHTLSGTELLYNLSDTETVIDTLDIGNVWTFNLISSNPGFEPRYIPFSGEVNPDIEGAYMDDEIWTNTVDGSASSKSKPAALKPGYAYSYTAIVRAHVGYRFADDIDFTYLGEPAENAVLTLSEDHTTLTITGLEKVTFLLDRPVLKSAAVAYGGVKVTWDAVKGASKYRVFRKQTGKGWTKLGDTTALSYADKTAVSGTTYTYTVRCLSADGKVYESAYDTDGKSVAYVAAPIISKFTNVNTGTQITWSAVKGAKYYRVFVKNGTSWKALGDTTATSFIATKRAAGTKYTYTVRAMNANKKFVSAYNTTGWSYTFIAAPAVPKLANTKNGVQITYTKSKGGVYFRIFRKQAGKGWTKVADTSAVKYVDKTAKNGVRYYYTVRCISKDGKTYYSGFNPTGSTIVCKR